MLCGGPANILINNEAVLTNQAGHPATERPEVYLTLNKFNTRYLIIHMTYLKQLT
jgi:hypothetical protein